MENRSFEHDKKGPVPFDRKIFHSVERINSIGMGAIGGKAQGLVLLNQMLQSNFDLSQFPQIEVCIPALTVIRTEVFDAFMARNDLYEIAYSDIPDDRIAHAFQQGDLPFEILGDLKTMADQVRTPLAVRSSSLLEDATFEPFAGVYGTKMIPNHQHETSTRFRRLVEAIKFVYASTYSRSAKNYRKVTKHKDSDEKMAVIIQEVIGKRHHNRFYPELSGVARSYNYYPVGRALQEDGVVNLAFGLGKTIVDGGISWAYSPAYPKIGPPYGSIRDLLQSSQKEFWAINMGTPPPYNPLKESEYLLQENFVVGELDGTLALLCSTYDAQSDRLNPGLSSKGPRVLNFAPLLSLGITPFNELIIRALSLCESKMNSPVEIEFAMTFNPHKLGFLQVRPMVVSADEVEISTEELSGEEVLIASENALGNGIIDHLQDIVYVNPKNFDKSRMRQIASELGSINSDMVRSDIPYLLIVFGRLGSSDPWLGIPVNWGQISGARVIVEASQENLRVEMSQGSHFFHNLTALGVGYFSLPYFGKYQVNWKWLESQDEIQSTHHIRHVRTRTPLLVKIDGRKGSGVIYGS